MPILWKDRLLLYVLLEGNLIEITGLNQAYISLITQALRFTALIIKDIIMASWCAFTPYYAYDTGTDRTVSKMVTNN